MPDAIRTTDLTRHFGSLQAVEGVDLRVPRGSIFGFLGPNGAGKTTTLHLLLGIVEPTRGTAEVAGHDVARQPDDVRRRCGALLEHHGLYERMTAWENLEFYGRIHRLGAAERQQRVRELLDGIGLWERRNEPVGRWSKGMKQQLAIARTLIHRPDIVFLDEPTNGFDPAAAARLRDQMRALAKDGTTVFLTTHNLPEAEAVCDRVGVIRAGRLVATGPPRELTGDGRIHLNVVAAKAPKAALATIGQLDGVQAAERTETGLQVTLRRGTPVAPVVKALVQAGVPVEEVRRAQASLEESFLRLVRGTENTADAHPVRVQGEEAAR